MINRFPLLLGAMMSFSVLVVAPTAWADDDDDDQIFSTATKKSLVRLVGELPEQVQRMTVEALLVALDVERKERLESLADARIFYLRVYKVLREGLHEGGDADSLPPEITETFDRMEQIWQAYDKPIRHGLKAKTFSVQEVVRVSQMADPLYELARDLSEAYEHHYGKGTIRSVLVPLTEESERQGARLQRMFKAYLLIAESHEVQKNRRILTSYANDFDRVLNGLTVGDQKLRLIPAVTAQIAGQLGKVHLEWNEFYPIMLRAANSGQVDRATITRAADLFDELLEEMEEVTEMYDDL